jgi:hypothetical protein
MEDNKKKCYKCKCYKALEDFNKCKSGKLGVHGHCRECQKKVRRDWYLKHRTEILLQLKSPEMKEYIKKTRYNKYHTDSIWKNIILEQNRIRRRSEPAKIKARIQRKRWYEIPQNKIACSLRTRIRKALKFKIKIDTTESLLGCSFDSAKQYIESLFLPGMTWKNYGKWHIDHIIPCSYFDLKDAKQQKICFNFRNLQPLWSNTNISKGNKINIDDIKLKINSILEYINNIHL